MIDDPSSVTNKDLDILLKWQIGSETLPGAVSKNKVTRERRYRGAAKRVHLGLDTSAHQMDRCQVA
jgi:hypothetical protein